MAPTNKKWIIWTSDTTGEYVRASRVIEGDKFISFIRETNSVDVVVARYKKEDVQDYHIVE